MVVGQKVDAVMGLVPLFPGYEIVEFQGEHLREILPVAVLDKRGDFGVGSMLETDGHPPVHPGHFGIVFHQIPLGGEFAHLLSCKFVFENNDSAGNEIAFHRLSLGFSDSGRLRWRFHLFCFLVLGVLIAFFLAVQDVVHALFDLVADVVFHGLFGAFAEAPEKALGGGGPADECEDSPSEDVLFHGPVCSVFHKCHDSRG